MPFIAIAPPPGIARSGTVYQSKGRWWDSNLMRPQEDALRPILGWQKRSDAVAFSGAARAILAWRDNGQNGWIAVGTHSHLYVQDEAGANHDITPSGFTVGRANAEQNLGYGGGTYGSGFYGVPPSNTVAFRPASVWSQDGWGEHWVGCCDTDGKIYEWSLVTATPAAQVANSPTSCAGIVVTQDGFLFALGAGGDGRRVAWSDQQNNTVWAASPTNQAGDYDLPTVGTIQTGKMVPGGALIFTDIDVWLAQYVGPQIVYGFHRAGTGCGPISKGAVATRDSIAAWMGRGAFWLFDGQSVQPLPCEARGAVFDNMNGNQVSKVTTVHLADQGEVWWFFPSATSVENDSYVAWCYRESERLGRNVWMVGKLGRTCATGAAVFPNPLMVDPSGFLQEHETGLNYDGAQPYIESGVFELGQGDRLMEIQRIIPDQFSDGDLAATIYGRMWPSSVETARGPYTLTSPTCLLMQAREVRIRYTVLNPAQARVGTMRFDIIPGDLI